MVVVAQRLLWWVLLLLCFGVAGYAVLAYGFLPLGSLVHPEMQAAFQADAAGIYTHIFASVVALILGPFQFSERLRQRRPQLHRWLGRLYLGVGILLGGLAGLYMAQFAFGGWVSQLGFSLLAVGWLYTGLRAFLAVRRGHIAAHRAWMYYNFALTLAAVTIRLYLPIGGLLGISFPVWYPAVTWLCWVPNLLGAKALLAKRAVATSGA